MFTINANPTKKTFANEFVEGNYPNVENVLIKWNGQDAGSGTKTPSNFTADLVVGDTPINNLSETMQIDLILSGNIANAAALGNNTPVYGSINNTNVFVNSDFTYRVGLYSELPEGKVVGKNIRAFVVGCLRSQGIAGGTITGKFKEISYTFKLLHTDGSLTTIATLVFLTGGTTDYTHNSATWAKVFGGFLKYTGAGTTTLAGDMIVCDIRCSVDLKYATANASYYAQGGIAPGYAGSGEPYYSFNGAKPIEISIE